MSPFHIKDYGLSVLLLEAKWSPDGDGHHPGYPTRTWRAEVENDNTRLGYWAWVHHQLEEERDELEADSPYN